MGVETCYPDMVQIPALAGFFGVSLDTLFCYDVTQLNTKIDAVIEEAGRYFWGNRDKCEEIYLRALKEYPDNERLRTELLELYVTRGCENKSKEELTDFAKQLAADAKDVFLQFRAKGVLISLYLRQDRYEEVKAIIETLPVVYPYMLGDKMRMSAYTLKGEDRLTWAKEWKIIEIQELYIACELEGTGFFETGRYEEALSSFGQYRRVIEMFMKSEEIYLDSYLWNGMQPHHWCSYLREASMPRKAGTHGGSETKAAPCPRDSYLRMAGEGRIRGLLRKGTGALSRPVPPVLP